MDKEKIVYVGVHFLFMINLHLVRKEKNTFYFDRGAYWRMNASFEIPSSA